MKVKLKRAPWEFILFAVIICILDGIIENINGRFWLYDFRVYYSAAQQALINGKVYGIHFGLDTGFYKYSPFMLLVFMPYCILSYKAACILHFCISSVTLVFTFLILQKIAEKYFFLRQSKRRNSLLSIAFICVAVHLVRELHLGNVNIILLFFLSAGLLFLLRSKKIAAGTFLGLVILVKPFFVLLFLPLWVHKQWKSLYSASCTIAVLILLPALYFGVTKNIALHREWIMAMAEHSEYLKSTNTIQSLIRFYILNNSISLTGWFVIAICISYLLISISNKTRNNSRNNSGKANSDNKLQPQPQSLIIAYFFFLAIIPNLLITDTEHFLYALPLIMIILNYLFLNGNYILMASFIVLIFFYGGNSSDLLGNKLSDRFAILGVLGLGNLGIIGFALFVYFKEKSTLAASDSNADNASSIH